jgi:hypothetical protein
MAGKVDSVDMKAVLDKLADDAANEALAAEQAPPAQPYQPQPTPDAAANYEGTVLAPQSAPRQGGPLTPTGSYSQDQIGLQKLNEINQLEASGMVAPGTAALMRERLGMPLQKQGISDQQITADQNLAMAQENPEAFNLMNQSMQVAGLDAPRIPTPLAPPGPLPQPVQPDVERQLAAQAQAEELARQEMKQQERVERAAESKIGSTEEKAKEAVGGSGWGNIIAQAIAVGIGEYGRQLTGGENLALKTIERLAKERQEKEKLTTEQALAEKKLALDETMAKLKAEELKTDSALKRAQIGKMAMEIAAEQQKIALQRQIAARMSSGQGFSAQELGLLPGDDRERALQMPDGTFKLAARAEDAKKVKAEVDDIKEAREGIKGLLELNKQLGNNPLRKIFDRDAVAEAKTLQTAITGKLRLQLFGPGVLTDFEQKLAKGIIRDPSQILSLASANQKALEVLMRKLQFSERQRIQSAGIEMPPDPNTENIKKLLKLDPKMTEAEAMTKLMNIGKWQD